LQIGDQSILSGVEDLRDSFKVFAEAVRAIAEFACAHFEPYVVLDYEPRINLTSRIWNIVPVPRKAYPLDAEKLFKELKDHDAVKRCLEFMLQEEFPKRLEMTIVDREGKPVVDLDYKPFLFSEVLAPLVYEYIQEFGCVFSEQNFEKLFNEMMTYVYAEGWEVVAVAPLENFELVGAEEVSIDKFKIRRLSEWEMKQLIRIGRADSLGTVFEPTLGVIKNVWCIEVSTRAPKRVMPELSSDINEFVTIMRLFKSGFVTNSVVLEYPKIEVGKRSPKVSASFKLVRLHTMYAGYPKYTLNRDEADSLNQLWNLYRRVKDVLPRELRTALRWFDKSYEEPDDEDRVLDLAIAFEAMFGRRYYEVLAPRLIASDFNERRKIAKHLKELKDMRDNIVHGGRGGRSRYELEIIVINAEEIFRKCYKKFLDLIVKGKKHNEIIDEVLYE